MMKETKNLPQTKKGARKQLGEFVCMRHQEVNKNKPGKCPKCGKSLRLKK